MFFVYTYNVFLINRLIWIDWLQNHLPRLSLWRWLSVLKLLLIGIDPPFLSINWMISYVGQRLFINYGLVRILAFSSSFHINALGYFAFTYSHDGFIGVHLPSNTHSLTVSGMILEFYVYLIMIISPSPRISLLILR